MADLRKVSDLLNEIPRINMYQFRKAYGLPREVPATQTEGFSEDRER